MPPGGVVWWKSLPRAPFSIRHFLHFCHKLFFRRNSSLSFDVEAECNRLVFRDQDVFYMNFSCFTKLYYLSMQNAPPFSPPYTPLPRRAAYPGRPHARSADACVLRNPIGTVSGSREGTRRNGRARFRGKTTPRTGCNSNPFGVCLRDKLRLMEGIHIPCSCNVFSQNIPTRPSP